MLTRILQSLIKLELHSTRPGGKEFHNNDVDVLCTGYLFTELCHQRVPECHHCDQADVDQANISMLLVLSHKTDHYCHCNCHWPGFWADWLTLWTPHCIATTCYTHSQALSRDEVKVCFKALMVYVQYIWIWTCMCIQTMSKCPWTIH